MKHVPLLVKAAALAVIITGIASCRSTKNVVDTNIAVTTSPAAGKSAATRFDEIVAREGEWSELQVPVRVELRSPMSVSVSGRAYMRRGKDIYVTLKVMGFEVANLYVTTDSVFATVKPGKKYLAESLEEVFGATGLTVSDIQDALTGRLFVVGKDTPTQKDVKLTVGTNGMLTAAPKKKVAGATYLFTFSKSDIPQSLVVNYDGREVKLNYSEASRTVKGLFMQQSSLKTTEGKTTIDASVRLDFGKAKWEVSPSVGWRKPGGSYTRINGKALLMNLGTE